MPFNRVKCTVADTRCAVTPMYISCSYTLDCCVNSPMPSASLGLAGGEQGFLPMPELMVLELPAVSGREIM